MTPDFAPANEQERAVLDQVIKAKKDEQTFYKGDAAAGSFPSEGPRVPLYPSPNLYQAPEPVRIMNEDGSVSYAPAEPTVAGAGTSLSDAGSFNRRAENGV